MIPFRVRLTLLITGYIWRWGPRWTIRLVPMPLERWAGSTWFDWYVSKGRRP